jgi:hypothetical protein
MFIAAVLFVVRLKIFLLRICYSLDFYLHVMVHSCCSCGLFSYVDLDFLCICD